MPDTMRQCLFVQTNKLKLPNPPQNPNLNTPSQSFLPSPSSPPPKKTPTKNMNPEINLCFHLKKEMLSGQALFGALDN